MSYCILITSDLVDEQLSLRYSSCDCTILPTAGEGFGFPIVESLACGTSCITTNYAAGPALVPPACRVMPIAYRVDTIHNVVRAVLDGPSFYRAAVEQVELKREQGVYRSHELSGSVAHLSWDALKYPWTKWLLEGVQ